MRDVARPRLVMHPPATRAHALELIAGFNDCEVARRIGVPRSTVRDWRRPVYRRRSQNEICPRCWRPAKPIRFAAEDYAEFLGFYLGESLCFAIGRHAAVADRARRQVPRHHRVGSLPAPAVLPLQPRRRRQCAQRRLRPRVGLFVAPPLPAPTRWPGTQSTSAGSSSSRGRRNWSPLTRGPSSAAASGRTAARSSTARVPTST